MGIQGLLPFIEKSSRRTNVSEFAGRTVAVDAYCWLHKGAFSCAEKLARKEETVQYVVYCMKFVNMLLSHNIKPILVFDGQHLPAKAETEKVRRERREVNRQKAAELLRSDRGDEARSYIRRCIDVTHAMALALMKECRRLNVDCIVAPYEADAQLAYLNMAGIAHLVITEDSDLLPFGCHMVLFKMDVNGNGVLVEQAMLPLALKQRPEQFSLTKFRQMCILSGCDYLASLPGIGLTKAKKFIMTTVDNDISRALTRMHGHLNMPNLNVTEEYRRKFLEADSMFRHQPVFDPLSRTIVPLTPLAPGEQEPLRVTITREDAVQLAYGNLDPFTKKRVDNWDPDQLPEPTKGSRGWGTVRAPHVSIWSTEYKLPKPLRPRPDPRDIVRAPSTKNRQVVQPVSTLTEKLQSFRAPATATPAKRSNDEEELEKLRRVYGVCSPPSKRSCLESLQGGDSDIIELDELIGDSRSPFGKSNNPFKTRTPPKTPQEGKRSSFLSRLSKIKKTIIDDSTIVKSKYFGNVEEEEEEKAMGGCAEETRESRALVKEEGISPKADRATPTTPVVRAIKIEDLFSPIRGDEESDLRLHTTPAKRRNVFAVLPAPSVAEESDFDADFGLDRRPKKRSFLGLIDAMGRVGDGRQNGDDASSQSEAENKNCGGRVCDRPANFKWAKSPNEIRHGGGGDPPDESAQKSFYFGQVKKSISEGVKTEEGIKSPESLESDPKWRLSLPDTPPSSQGTTISSQGSTTSVRNKLAEDSSRGAKRSLMCPARRVGLTKRKSTTSSTSSSSAKKSPKSAADPKQTSLLTMFGFQPKSKLRL